MVKQKVSRRRKELAGSKRGRSKTSNRRDLRASWGGKEIKRLGPKNLVKAMEYSIQRHIQIHRKRGARPRPKAETDRQGEIIISAGGKKKRLLPQRQVAEWEEAGNFRGNQIGEGFKWKKHRPGKKKHRKLMDKVLDGP